MNKAVYSVFVQGFNHNIYETGFFYKNKTFFLTEFPCQKTTNIVKENVCESIVYR